MLKAFECWLHSMLILCLFRIASRPLLSRDPPMSKLMIAYFLGDLEKVIDVQGRVAQAEQDGLSVEALGGALEQLANYAVSLTDAQVAADAAPTDSAKADAATVPWQYEEELMEIDMRGWYAEPACAEALARLHAELIYLRPASTSPLMELVLAFDEMFAFDGSLFVKTMSSGFRQQALHTTNVEKSSRGTKMERKQLSMGYCVSVGAKREFFFQVVTEAEVLTLFEAVRQVCSGLHLNSASVN